MTGSPTHRLPVLKLLADTGRAYLNGWTYLIPLALVVLLPQAIGHTIGIDVDAEVDLSEIDLREKGGAFLAGSGLVAVGLAGEALYAGVITALVVEWRLGLPRTDLRALVGSLPYLRLILADILIVVGTVLGLVLLVVPGIVFATYFLLTTVVIELEHRSVRRSMARSAGLVRGSFWRVLAIVLVTVVGTEVASAAIEAPFEHFPLATLANLAIESIIEPFQGVATVLVALGLMELRGQRPRDPGRAARRTSERD